MSTVVWLHYLISNKLEGLLIIGDKTPLLLFKAESRKREREIRGR